MSLCEADFAPFRRCSMLLAVEMSGMEELFVAVVAVLILATSVFGLDTLIFRRKRVAAAGTEIPKQRIHYIVEEEPEDTEVPDRSRR
jgi:hypothetical protein